MYRPCHQAHARKRQRDFRQPVLPVQLMDACYQETEYGEHRQGCHVKDNREIIDAILDEPMNNQGDKVDAAQQITEQKRTLSQQGND